MRIIKSKSYMRKEAIWSSLPGDSNLPPGVSQGDIDDRFSSPEDDIVGDRCRLETIWYLVCCR